MRRSTAAFLVRASFLIVLVPLDVYGLWTVLAHGWHVVGRVGGVGPCWPADYRGRYTFPRLLVV
jgi:hypothetical protein